MSRRLMAQPINYRPNCHPITPLLLRALSDCMVILDKVTSEVGQVENLRELMSRLRDVFRLNGMRAN